MFEKFSQSAIRALMLAQEEARRLQHNFVGTEQLLLGVLGQNDAPASQILNSQGLTITVVRRQIEQIIGRGSSTPARDIPFTPRAKRVLELGVEEARLHGQEAVTPEHILLGLLRDGEGVATKVLEDLGIDRDQLRTLVVASLGDAARVAASGRSGPVPSQGKQGSALERFGRDLTELARAGKIDPVIGRAAELERVVQILGRRTKNNPVLIGEPGVGKTAIAEGLALRITDADVPEHLLEKRIVSLELASLLAGTQLRGEFEERLKQVITEVREDKNVMLFIDEIHTLVGAGAAEGSMDAANILKPALARGEFQCIGATTLDEYRKHIERDAALERRFQPVTVGEPSVEETVEILRGLRERYEQYHKLTITDDALLVAAQLSDRYITDRFLPDKAIDLIDEAGSMIRVRLSRKQTTDAVVDSKEIAEIVSDWTGVPTGRLTGAESESLLHLEARLHERIIGQEDAVRAVARAVRRARVGLKSPKRPIASFIFSGPTGVGKTELAKALAATVFGSEDAMIRLDMSEYMERHTASKLIGSPPGYVGYDEGGQLTEAVRRHPYTVILFDEIEKAHPDVFNILLQILEDGRLTDARGRTIDFKNTLMIMTSNVGSRVIEKGGGGLGFTTSGSEQERRYQNVRNLVNEELKQHFRPEFLNRLDEIIVFQPLTRDEIAQIARLLLSESLMQVKALDIDLEASPAFIEKLVNEGYSATYGARPLRRALQRLLEDTMADAILEGRFQNGDQVLIDVDRDGKVVLSRPDTTTDEVGVALSVH
ncbi:MAG: ATP-dependent Clp protease ATP-binding subunit [Gemmatimonadaceae bacterium]|nr:ATP-dependent Clp protease ATP-binding subunit [Gloeobacterales cyanobacterium ES-bin-141]